jgi:putative spermidine/putrescine transport system permease protein
VSTDLARSSIGPAGVRWRIVASPTRWMTYGVLAFFLTMLAGIVGSVLLSSFATRWLATWTPEGYTTRWYRQSWEEFDLTSVLIVTAQVAVAVVIVSLLIAVPAAYALARRNFPGKRAVMVLFLLPIVVPTITYGVPLAVLFFELHLALTLTGVVLINLVPAVPFAILILVPFVEQIDVSLEKAARVFGAGQLRIFTRIVLPLLLPGIVAVSVLLLVRTLALFDLTFLVAGPEQTTLVVKLFAAVGAAGFRADQSVDAMAVIYMAANVALLAVALKFISPSRLVSAGS